MQFLCFALSLNQRPECMASSPTRDLLQDRHRNFLFPLEKFSERNLYAVHFINYIARVPKTLKLFKSFHMQQLRTNSDMKDVNIWGTNEINEDILFYSDLNNRNVKKLEISTGQTNIVFIENDGKWNICNTKKVIDQHGESLFVLEGNNNKNTRVCICKLNGDIYNVEQNIPLGETTNSVCI